MTLLARALRFLGVESRTDDATLVQWPTQERRPRIVAPTSMPLNRQAWKALREHEEPKR